MTGPIRWLTPVTDEPRRRGRRIVTTAGVCRRGRRRRSVHGPQLSELFMFGKAWPMAGAVQCRVTRCRRRGLVPMTVTSRARAAAGIRAAHAMMPSGRNEGGRPPKPGLAGVCTGS